MKRLSFIICHLSFSIALAFTACSSDDDIVNEQPVNPTEPKTYTMTIKASKGDDATTRGLSLDGNTLNVKWNEGEKVWVLDNNLNILGSLTADASADATTTLRGTITTSSKPVYLNLYLHNYNMVYTGQTGVLLKPASGTDNSIESNYDYARTDNISYNNYSVDETTSTLTVNTTANFVSHQAIVKFSLFEADGTTPIKPTSLTLTTKSPMLWFLDYSNSGEGNTDFGKTLELSGLSGTTNDIYVAISNFTGKTMTLTATTANGYTYTYTKSSDAQLFTHGKYYAVKVKMQKSAPAAAEAVDLGLSSGTKWANMNVGATTETDRGYYFAWAGTTGYAYESGHNFSQDNAPYFGNTYSKYIGSDYTVLQPVDDAASQNWGGAWRMPTKDEWEELKNNCTAEWKENYKGFGINGILFTSKKEGFTDKSIFLPANGYYYGTSLYFPTINVLYWSSNYDLQQNALTQDYTNYGYAYVFDVSYGNNQFHWTNPSTTARYRGVAVRPVCP